MQPTYGAKQIADGQYTLVIYSLFKDQKYSEAITILNSELQNNPRSRAALSLLGYAYFHNQDFENAAQMYERLVKVYPEVDDYKLYYAQALHKACMYPEALKACQSIENQAFAQKVNMLQVAIMYEQEEVQHAKSLLNQVPGSAVDMIVAQGCLLYKEGKYEDARQKFQEAINLSGYQCDLAYNIALCYYKLKQLAPALKYIADIIEKGVKEHPELGVGSNAEGIEVKSVGNTQVLKYFSINHH